MTYLCRMCGWIGDYEDVTKPGWYECPDCKGIDIAYGGQDDPVSKLRELDNDATMDG